MMATNTFERPHECFHPHCNHNDCDYHAFPIQPVSGSFAKTSIRGIVGIVSIIMTLAKLLSQATKMINFLLPILSQQNPLVIIITRKTNKSVQPGWGRGSRARGCHGAGLATGQGFVDRSENDELIDAGTKA